MRYRANLADNLLSFHPITGKSEKGGEVDRQTLAALGVNLSQDIDSRPPVETLSAAGGRRVADLCPCLASPSLQPLAPGSSRSPRLLRPRGFSAPLAPRPQQRPPCLQRALVGSCRAIRSTVPQQRPPPSSAPPSAPAPQQRPRACPLCSAAPPARVPESRPHPHRRPPPFPPSRAGSSPSA
uniref:Sulfated surface glycoprotein 185-like n=1 Tax=Phascolarctos cinereus TaxID=38626 RepID=A0A6P5INT6_PHACI|nr:sulfated surface glycoprotein 185-like [Phascolarctos cinereus]